MKLDTSEPLPDQPAFKGQIGEPSPEYIRVFRSQYGPIMNAARLSPDTLRVLEIGAGTGRTTQAFLREYSPAGYIASEPFPSLAAVLRENLNEWGYSWPNGIAANYNANSMPLLAPGSVNVILGNSVLHHILEYENGLEHWSKILDRPGLMIFGEPIKEGWAYWTSLVLVLLKAYRSGGLSLSTRTVETLARHAQNMQKRLAGEGNRASLTNLDDKHMFSPLKMMNLASDMGLSLSIHKPDRNILQLMKIRLERIGIAEADVTTAMDFLREIIPDGIAGSCMSDFAAMFVFAKA